MLLSAADYISGSVYAMDGSVGPDDSRHLIFVAAPRILCSTRRPPQPRHTQQSTSEWLVDSCKDLIILASEHMNEYCHRFGCRWQHDKDCRDA